jgi:hypothetical protein
MTIAENAYRRLSVPADLRPLGFDACASWAIGAGWARGYVPTYALRGAKNRGSFYAYFVEKLVEGGDPAEGFWHARAVGIPTFEEIALLPEFRRMFTAAQQDECQRRLDMPIPAEYATKWAAAT